LKSKLIDFDYIIKYRKGLLNQVCDAMSRYPVENPISIKEPIIEDNKKSLTQIKQINIQILQANDIFLTNIIQAINMPEVTNHIWIRKSKNYFFNHFLLNHYLYYVFLTLQPFVFLNPR